MCVASKDGHIIIECSECGPPFPPLEPCYPILATEQFEGAGTTHEYSRPTDISRDPTTCSMSQQNSPLEDDERFIQRSEEELEAHTDQRAVFVWRVIGRLLAAVGCCSFPKRQELWLRIIEGDTDDDVWLWVQGDEGWLAKHGIPYRGVPGPKDWLSARSALRRRIDQQRYPPVTGRNEKVRRATPQQRVYAIAWLIASSKGVAELFACHGRTSPVFRTPRIAFILSGVLVRQWDIFPSKTGAWENALRTSKEEGCICSPTHCCGMRQWFDMMVWLEDTPPILEVGYEPCARCRLLLKLRYDDLAARCAVTAPVFLLDAFCNFSSGDVPLSSRLSPTAKLLGDRLLEPLMKEHGVDVQYLPSVNRYPESLRQYVAEHLCVRHCNPQNNRQTAEFPDKLVDGAHDPWVLLGVIALATYDTSAGGCRDLHDEDWHSYFSSFLRHSLRCFDMPVHPRLSSTGFTLCHALDQDYSEEYSFGRFGHTMDESDWVKSDRDGRQLRLATAVTVAVTMFLRNTGVDLHGCRRCQAFCMKSLTSAPSTVTLEVESYGEREGPQPPSVPIRGEDDAPGESQSSPCQGSLEVGVQEPAGMVSLDPDSASGFPRGSISGPPTLPKSDKRGKIRDALLGMLRELNLPHKRLPWSTFEKDSEKHGYVLINWPAGVLRKRGNKGIQDLIDEGEVNTLYEAITHPDESRRLRICRRSSPSTVTPIQPVNNTPAAALGSKRAVPEEPELPSHPPKMYKFRYMTHKAPQ